MSEIFPTTMHPSKHELIGPWLPNQPWFSGVGTPELENVGGFRVDDPAGEVGLEFIFVRDNASPAHVVYHVPLTYRGAPLEDAESALLGTSEHGGAWYTLDLRCRGGSGVAHRAEGACCR